MTAKIQTGVTNPVPAVNPANNQFTGSSYDLNGNMISGVGATLGYDEANRLSSVAPTSGGTGYYGYAPDNKRIYQALPSRYGVQEAWTFYGAHGEKLGVYQWFDVRGDGTCTGGCALRPQTWIVWFGGKMIYEGGSSVYEVGTAAGATYHDRVGTNRANGARFYPYGDQISGIASDHEMFATYQRDGFTGLDYADQRYYASSYGRFATVDPMTGSTNPKIPLSWNRYLYVLGDPVNSTDHTGSEVDCDGDACDFDCDSDWGGSDCTYDTGAVFDATGTYDTDSGAVLDPDPGPDPTSGPPGKGKKKKKKRGGTSPYDQLKAAFANVATAINSEANSYFTADLLDCWAGMESSFDPNALNGSHRGLFQLNAAAWAASGVGVPFTQGNANDPATNAAAAVGYLSFLIQKYVDPSGFNNGAITAQDITQALTDYRWGPSSKTATDTYANDITKCAGDLGAGNWNAAMKDLGK